MPLLTLRTTTQLLKCGLHATTNASTPSHSYCSAGCSACHPRSTGQQGHTVAANCLLQLLQSLPISDLRSGSSLQQLRQELTAQPNSPGLHHLAWFPGLSVPLVLRNGGSKASGRKSGEGLASLLTCRYDLG